MRSASGKSVERLPHPWIRLALVMLGLGMMGMAVWSVGNRLRARPNEVEPDATVVASDHLGSVTHDAPAESAMYHPPIFSTVLPASSATVPKQRNLVAYYDLRQYVGSPPRIPHPVDPDIEREMRCNVCHEKGGYVPSFNAYTPITPHPHFSNCMQCHVKQVAENLFVSSTWVSVRVPELQRSMLPGSPPPIPHTLDLRDNCLACHGGLAAPLEIRTSHPERVQCRQCHLPAAFDQGFERRQVAQQTHDNMWDWLTTLTSPGTP